MTPTAGQPRLAFFLPSLEGGGAERVTLNLASGFASRGFATDMVLATADGAFLPELPSSVRLVDLKAGKVMRALPPLARYLRRERPVAMLAALNHANLIAMAAASLPGVKTRIIISIHCTISTELALERDIRMRLIAWTLGRLHRLADGIVAVSKGVADDAAVTIRIPRQRMHVIYNPVVMPTLFQRAAVPPPHPWFEPGAPPVVLSVGRLTRQKNFVALIDAFALVRRHHDARLVILGEGPERAAIEARVAAHSLAGSVSLPGFIDNPYACMSRAAVFALSSHFEGLPTVLIESLALGTPIVSTDCPSGPREILRDGALGTLVPTGDETALASGIARALTAERAPTPLEDLYPFTPEAALDAYQRVLAPCTC